MTAMRRFFFPTRPHQHFFVLFFVLKRSFILVNNCPYRSISIFTSGNIKCYPKMKERDTTLKLHVSSDSRQKLCLTLHLQTIDQRNDKRVHTQ